MPDFRQHMINYINLWISDLENLPDDLTLNPHVTATKDTLQVLREECFSWSHADQLVKLRILNRGKKGRPDFEM